MRRTQAGEARSHEHAILALEGYDVGDGRERDEPHGVPEELAEPGGILAGAPGHAGPTPAPPRESQTRSRPARTLVPARQSDTAGPSGDSRHAGVARSRGITLEIAAPQDPVRFVAPREEAIDGVRG